MSSFRRGNTHRPPLWLKMSVQSGNLVQLAEAGTGCAMLRQAAHRHSSRARRVSLMLGGWWAIYLSTHAIAHWAIGRVVGIRFTGYGMRGTDHPHVYPPGVRQIMSVMPFFTAVTDKRDPRRASPAAKAVMLAAGQASTTICSLLVAWYARQTHTPEARAFSRVLVAYTLFLAIVNLVAPEGDFARARAALRTRGQSDTSKTPAPETDGHRQEAEQER